MSSTNISPTNVQAVPGTATMQQPAQSSSHSSRCQKIILVVQTIFICLAGLALFLYSPIIFLVSFTIGIIFSDQAKEAVSKIVHLWRARSIMMTILAVGASILALPATLTIASCIVGLHLGSAAHLSGRTILPASV